MPDTIQEFMVSLGFSVNSSQQQQFLAAIKNTNLQVANISRQLSGQAPLTPGQGAGGGAAPGLGPKTNPSAFRQLNQLLHQTTRTLGELGEKATVVGTAFYGFMQSLGEHWEQVYFLSQRTNTSADQLVNLGFAARQVGAGAEVASQALVALRQDFQLPGVYQAFTKQITGFQGVIKTEREGFDLILAHWYENIRLNREYVNRWEADILHLDYEALRPLALNLREMNAERERSAARWKEAGLDLPKVAKDAHDFGEAFRSVGQALEVTGTLFFETWVKPVTDGFGKLEGVIRHFNVEFQKLGDKPMGRLRQEIVSLATLGAAYLGVRGIARGAMGFLGLRAAGGAAAGAAGGAAAGAAAGGAVGTVSRFALRRLLGPVGLALVGGEWLHSMIPETHSGPGADWQRSIHRDLRKPGDKNIFERLWELIFPSAHAEEAGPMRGRRRHGDLWGLTAEASLGAAPVNDVFSEISAWLHGTGALVPQVRLSDMFGDDIGGGDAGIGGGGGAGARSRHGDILGLGGSAVLPGNWGTGLPRGVSNVSKAIDFFREKGLTDPQIAGAIGVFQQESGKGLNPLARNPTSGALGIAQWLGSRQRGFGPDVDSQFKRIWDEFQGPEHNAFERLKAAKTAPEAALAMRGFERGGDYGGRDIAAANRLLPALEQYGPQVPPSVTNQGDRNVTVDNRTNISITGEFQQNLGSLDEMLRRHNGDMIRDLSGAVR